MKHILLPKTSSTNSYVVEHESSLDDMTMVRALSQTAGRGQRGNHWESEPGANLTFSVLWRPHDFPAREQFAVSEAVACAIVRYLEKHGITAKVKWPNDIYVGDKKISGILIENSLFGPTLSRTVAGVGININQQRFLSDAPNPVSLWQLTGKKYDLAEEDRRVGTELETALLSVETPSGRKAIHEEFLSRMWRNDGEAYPFRDIASGVSYRGIIRGVEPGGILIIEETSKGALHRYAFKEVEFLIDE